VIGGGCVRRLIAFKWSVDVGIGRMLDLFEERELESVPAFVSYAEIREDEITGALRSLQVGCTGNANAREHGYTDGGVADFAVGYRTCNFQRSVKHEARVVAEGDIVSRGNIVLWCDLGHVEDVERDDRWRIDRAPICRGWLRQ
jgi:hypothetical protein